MSRAQAQAVDPRRVGKSWSQCRKPQHNDVIKTFAPPDFKLEGRKGLLTEINSANSTFSGASHEAIAPGILTK